MNQRPLAAVSTTVRKHCYAAAAFSTLVLLAIAGILSVSPASAQTTSRIWHKVTKDTNTYGPALGRDLWFTMAQNYDVGGGNGKYYMLYVTSPNKTSVNIQVTGSTSMKFPIQAGQVVPFAIPLGWEVTTSGEVENKAIRVWSNDADITAYLLSRNPATSDGMYIVPSIGWGKEYVVAGYHSLFELTFDYPSEFCVVSNQNNTQISVIPTQDIRKTRQPKVVLHPRGATFSDDLMRGQCIQYQLTQADNADEWDVTGTIVTSNNPVGVVGASQCPNIPASSPYCDHICDMVPPVRTWAQTYYSAPFFARKGGDSFCFIASKDGQIIYRDNSSVPGAVECVLNKYQSFFDPQVQEATRWYSDAPFMCVQYCNSTDFPTPGANNGIGDPAMVVVNSVEQFTPQVIFQTPTITGAQTTFQNFLNIVVHSASVGNTYFDGKKLANAPRGSKINVDGKYEVWRFTQVAQGTHTIVSDTGVGAYVYGYGSYDSYAWAAALGNRTFNDPDHTAPTVDTNGMCFDAHVGFHDVHPAASKLSDMRLDTIYNLRYNPDLTFQAGSGRDSSFYDLIVIDPTLEAYSSVTCTDLAGNRTRVESFYVPQIATLTPDFVNYGTVVGGEKCEDITIENTGKAVFKLTQLKLKYGDKGFTIKSPNTSPLAVGEKRIITICFLPPGLTSSRDTLLVGDECVLQTAALVGNGGAPDFEVTDRDFGTQIKNGGFGASKTVTIRNLSSKVAITIKSASFDNVVNFKFADPTLDPANLMIKLNPSESKTLDMQFKATDIGRFVSHGTWTAVEIPDIRYDSVWGVGVEPGSSILDNQTAKSDCGGATADQHIYEFSVTSTSPTIADTLKFADYVGTPTTGFSPKLTVIDDRSNVVAFDPATPLPIPAGQTWKIQTTFVPPAKYSGIARADVRIATSTGDVTLYATDTVTYREAGADRTNSNPLMVTGYGTGVKPQQSFDVLNTATDDLDVLDVRRIPASAQVPYPDAFNLLSYTVNGVTQPLPAAGGTLPPVVLKKGEKMTVAYEFIDNYTDVTATSLPEIIGGFSVATNQCSSQPLPFGVHGMYTFKDATSTGFSKGPIFACTPQAQFDMQVTNANQIGGRDEEIRRVFITGTESSQFSYSLPAPMLVPAGQTVNFPITFAPAVTNAPFTAMAHVEFELGYVGDPNSKFTTGSDVSVISEGIEVTAQSNPSQGSAKVGASIDLPINLTIDKQGLPGMPLSDARITGARMDYTFNTDLLSIPDNNVAAHVTGLPAGWEVKPTSDASQPNRLILEVGTDANNPAAFLTDADASTLATIHLQVMLPGKDDQHNVDLVTFTVLTNGGATENACVQSKQTSGNFTLVYTCGDKLVQDIMSGNHKLGEIIVPATPNPAGATSNNVSMSYVVRGASTVNFVVYDMLGKEVSRIVDNVKQDAGRYDLKHDISALPNGTYTYRLQVGRWTTSQQVVINR